jgi:hypothetical protein
MSQNSLPGKTQKQLSSPIFRQLRNQQAEKEPSLQTLEIQF